jgi:hypothetical protein
LPIVSHGTIEQRICDGMLAYGAGEAGN